MLSKEVGQNTEGEGHNYKCTSFRAVDRGPYRNRYRHPTHRTDGFIVRIMSLKKMNYDLIYWKKHLLILKATHFT